MTGPTHALIGFASVVVLARATDLFPTPVGLLLVFLGSLAPDIDGDGAITRPGTIFNRFLPRSLAKIIDGLGEAVGDLANLIFGHRGFFHWPLHAILLMAAGYWLKWPLLFWFGWGYFTHLMADMCTYQGIPLLAPLRSRNYSLRFLATGSLTEFIIFGAVAVYTVVYGFDLLPEQTQTALKELAEKYRQ